jgi:hypothetical protein
MNMHRRYRQTRAVPQGGSHRRDTIRKHRVGRECAHRVMTTQRSDAWRPTFPTACRPTVPGRRPSL